MKYLFHAVQPGTLEGAELKAEDTQKLHASATKLTLQKMHFESMIGCQSPNATTSENLFMMSAGLKRQRRLDRQHDERASDAYLNSEMFPAHDFDGALRSARDEAGAGASLFHLFKHHPPLFGIRERFSRLLIDVANDLHEIRALGSKRRVESAEPEQEKDIHILVFPARSVTASAVLDPREMPIPEPGDIITYTVRANMLGSADITHSALFFRP